VAGKKTLFHWAGFGVDAFFKIMFVTRNIRSQQRPVNENRAVVPAVSGLAFWNCELTRLELVLLPAAILLAAALHLAPVLHSSLGTVLTYLLPAISYFAPLTSFFFFACSQFLPFPADSPHNPAQAGVLVWLPVILLRYRRVNLRNLPQLWPVLPWLVWFALLTGQAIYLPSSDYVKALVYSVMACQMVNESRGQYLKCLVGLCFGAILVMTAYWASELGLPVEVSDWGGDREGFARLGSVRADAVMVWPALLIGLSGLLGTQIAFASRSSPTTSPAWLTYATLLLTVASLPPLVSTMSHGAFGGFALVLLAVIWAMMIAGKGGAFANPRFQLLLRGYAFGIALVVVLFAMDAFQLRTKVLSLETYYKETSDKEGAAASRTGVWHDSIHTILKYPLFGIAVTGEQEEITSEYAEAGGYLSHNIFLDFGRAIGIPGMLLLAFFFFCPAVTMWKSGDYIRYIPFLLTHFALLIFWMSLSFTFYKTFWAFWMLAAMVANDNRSSIQPAPAVVGKSHRNLFAARTVVSSSQSIGQVK
jgi:O-antigen ligase